MATKCKQEQFGFQALGSRKVVADFGAGDVSSDGGGLLLREVESKRKWIEAASECFTDKRDPDLSEHSVLELYAQMIYGLCLGYEDLNDHDRLCTDPLLATLCGKSDPKGNSRRREKDKGKPLARKATLNRLQLGTELDDRYKRIVCDEGQMADMFVRQFIDRPREEEPRELVIDLDATDDPLHGEQEGRFFHGYYDHYCYLPLYIFCGSELLCAKLRPSNIDGAKGSKEEIARIVAILREQWPDVHIILRGDSGFCRDDLMAWCEANGVDYIFGLSRNPQLLRMIAPSMQSARRAQEILGGSVRAYQELRYRTRDSWSKTRRVIAKSEVLPGKENPRFIVTSLSSDYAGAAELYENKHCARGDLDNPAELMEFWNKTVASYDDLAGYAYLRDSADRINIDVQIKIGAAHSGYPLQGASTWGLTDLEKIKQKGCWGWFHELGHEAQSRPDNAWGYKNYYTFDGSIECTVNIFSAHARDVHGIKSRKGWGWTSYPVEVMKRSLSVSNDPDKTYASVGVATKLAMMLQLRDAFGWSAWKKVFRGYNRDFDSGKINGKWSDRKKRDEFLIRFSKVVKHDLTKWMRDCWGVQVSDSAVQELAELDLPDWLPAMGGVQGK